MFNWSKQMLRRRFTVVRFQGNQAEVHEELAIGDVLPLVPAAHRGWVGMWAANRVGSYVTPGKCMVVRTK